jgi:hypothetical protein
MVIFGKNSGGSDFQDLPIDLVFQIVDSGWVACLIRGIWAQGQGFCGQPTELTSVGHLILALQISVIPRES